MAVLCTVAIERVAVFAAICSWHSSTGNRIFVGITVLTFCFTYCQYNIALADACVFVFHVAMDMIWMDMKCENSRFAIFRSSECLVPVYNCISCLTAGIVSSVTHNMFCALC